MDQIFGTVERITFQNIENGYTVAKLKQPKQQELTTIVGSMPTLKAGASIACDGRWDSHTLHGMQFLVSHYEIKKPSDIHGIEKYLGSGLVKGIGPSYAKRIVKAFGTETLNIIDTTPEKLLGVEGIGKKRIQKIIDCWKEQASIRDLMLFLQKYDISPTYAQKIFKQYGQESIQKIENNPFHLARDIFGIGFKTADQIAQKMGMKEDDPKRVEAGIEFFMQELSQEGHTCQKKQELIPQLEEKLKIQEPLVEECIFHLIQEKRLVSHEVNQEIYLFLKPLYLAEKTIAREVNRLKSGSCYLRDVNSQRALDWVEKTLKISLAKNQKEAVEAALKEKVLIITGGPGTGKSTITNAILRVHEKLTKNILLAAPTGRAAKRMSEITYRSASTIHSLLEFSFQEGRFKHNRDNPLKCDLIIIDEASMIDTFLMASLLKAIPDNARVIFVGDIHQLPSVGAGNVLKDMILSQEIHTEELKEIFRQAKGSQIITNAHKINAGEFPYIKSNQKSDFFFLEGKEPQDVLETITSLVEKRLKNKYNFDPIQDIQVLAPMKKGIIGTENLNITLQRALNKNNPVQLRFFRQFAPQDKVMQIQNNYKKEVFNGDVGIVVSINSIEEELVVNFDGKEVLYDFSEVDELTLAYAVSIHKYQGSECPCVVIPVHTTHFKMLHRNLLYTGVTRGKKLVVIVGSKKALFIAVKNDEVKNRQTQLCYFLQNLANLE